MGLAGASADELARTKSALDAFLSDAGQLAAVRKVLAEAEGLTAEQRHVLSILEKTFKVGGRVGGCRLVWLGWAGVGGAATCSGLCEWMGMGPQQ